MKKIALFLLMCAMLAIGAFADDLSYELKISHDFTNNAVTAHLYVSQGDSVAAHVGFAYNKEKLILVNSDYSHIPDTIPTDADPNEYLSAVIKGANERIHITREYADVSSLINREKGLVMFGWYADISVKSIFAGEEIASFSFKLAEGVDFSDITISDVTPVVKEQTKDVTYTGNNGAKTWASGILAANAENERFLYEPEAGSKKLEITISIDERKAEIEEITEPDKGTDSEAPEENPKDNSESVEDKEISVKKTTDFGVEARVYENKIRVLWKKPENIKVSEYIIVISDKDGQTVRRISGITSVTKSITINSLAQDYDYYISIAAVKTDGETVYHSSTVECNTPVSAASSAIVFDIKYTAEFGTLYGMTREQAVFGSCATKSPTVYPKEGYKFVGWSVDGINAVDIEKYRIYDNTTFKAVFSKAE